jgi:hypothetical protein
MIDKDWLDKVALAASVYCEKPDVNEEEIDRFIEYLFKVYGYEQLLKIRGRK